MSVLALLIGLIFVATLLMLLVTYQSMGNDEHVRKAQEEGRNETYSDPYC